MLLSARAVRTRAHELYALVAQGQSEHFTLDEAALPKLAALVAEVTRQNYPDLNAIPYHSRFRHFSVGGVDRLASLKPRLDAMSPAERRRTHFDLVISSVLLDAGAGATWSYLEPSTGKRWHRSEGLGVASFDWFSAGGLSSDPEQPLRADATRLQALDEADLARAFGVNSDNPLVGLAGRAQLLQRLGQVVSAHPQYFGTGPGRPGGLVDMLTAAPAGNPEPTTVRADAVLELVLTALGPVWPGRPAIAGRVLGDVWPHSKWGPVPFHKLSQWLSYSLCEALELSGIAVDGIDELTGLAEYRNGGLFLDGGVIVPRNAAVLSERHAVSSDLVIEWRALTVALLDKTAELLREQLHLSRQSLPLAKVLEGGTWAAGRKLARERRADASPPLQIESDGTVF
jgi:hypothetical protein